MINTYTPAQNRALAATLLGQLLRKRKPFQGPTDPLLQKMPPSARAQMAAMIWGTYRYFPRYEAVAEKALPKPIRGKDFDIYALLLLGWHQLDHMRIKEHAIVNETVEAAKILKKSWASGMINTLLRHWPEHLEKVALDPRVQTAHPFWLLRALKKNWPTQSEAIITANNASPPMTLRIHSQKTTRETYLNLLSEQEIDATPHSQLPNCLTLAQPCPVQDLPFFAEGMVSIQDSAAQWITELVECAPNLRILDACAAPGGKTAALLEQSPHPIHITALEKDPYRFSLLQNTLERCQVTATALQADALLLDEWWDKELFDYILVDAPCSGTGVIRRHPDIKFLRTEAEVQDLIQQQRSLLQALWPCLKPGGKLIYATCSILQAENEEQMTWFCQEHPTAQPLPVALPWHLRPIGAQNLPGENGADGFYYAVLQNG